MKYLLLFAVISSVSLWAQNHKPRPKPPPSDETELSQSLASGLNYYAYVPVADSGASLTVDNLSHYDNHVMVVAERVSGERTSYTLNISEDGAAILGDISEYAHLYLISLQAFQVRSDRPISLFGMKTRLFTTTPPTRHLQLVEVENALGKRFHVGVTPDGVAHYPIYGVKFGEAEADGLMYRNNGGVLEIIER